MIRINLLPFRAARKKENIRRQVFLFVCFFLLVAVVLFYFQNSLSRQVEEWTSKVDQTRLALRKEEKNAKEVDQIKKQIETLKKKLAVIETLETNRGEPVRFLIQMSEMIVEKRMWLTSLESREGTVSISGIALDNKTVADFMTNLEKSGLFSSVNLRTLQKKVLKDINMKSFSISCDKTTAPKEAGKK